MAQQRGIELGAHQRRDGQQAQPRHEPEHQRELAIGVAGILGDLADDPRTEVLQQGEGDARSYGAGPDVEPGGVGSGEVAVHRGKHRDVDRHGGDEQSEATEYRQPGSVDDRRDHDRSDLRCADEHQAQQCFAALLGHGVALVDVDFPHVILRLLQRHECLRRRPQRAAEADDQCPPVAGQRSGIVLQLLSEYRDVGQCAVHDSSSEVFVAFEHEAEDGRGREHQREDREEAEEREHRCIAARDVAPPPVEGVDDHVDRDVPLAQSHHPVAGCPRHQYCILIRRCFPGGSDPNRRVRVPRRSALHSSG